MGVECNFKETKAFQAFSLLVLHSRSCGVVVFLGPFLWTVLSLGAHVLRKGSSVFLSLEEAGEHRGAARTSNINTGASSGHLITFCSALPEACVAPFHGKGGLG